MANLEEMRIQAAICAVEEGLEEEVDEILIYFIKALKRPKACKFQALEVHGRAEIRFINILYEQSALHMIDETLPTNMKSKQRRKATREKIDHGAI
ncbi:hypothetical protein SDJN03_29676, partial [Cucurbita argyrosperma subsp. sororia]